MNTARSSLSRRQALRALTSIAALAALPRPGRSSVARATELDAKPNLIFIVADALRADHTHPYGHGRDTTPELQSWIADEGVTFTRATSAAAWTYPGTAAMMTGRLPFRVGASWNNTLLPYGVPTLPGLLRAAGYTTVGFTSAPFSRASKGFGQGFDLYNDSLGTLPVDANGQASQLNSLALQWLNSWTGPGPLFLFLYYFDPHTWYRPPAPYDTRYDPTYQGALTPDVYKNGEPVVAGTITPSERDVEHLLALYDGEIAYWDGCLGQLLSVLDARGILQNAVVAVTSDHGDMFGEHGLWTHGNSVYEEVLRVPLLLRYSGVIPKGLTVDTAGQNMDVAPTMLEWAGAQPAAFMDGVSLATAATGQSVPLRDTFSEIDGMTDPANWAYWLAPRDTLHAVHRGEFKYIRHVGNEAADELYRIGSASLYERDNLLAAELEVAAELRAAVTAKFAQHRVGLPVVTR